MCATKPSSLQHLKVKVINVISRITVNQLANLFCELRKCITLCTANDVGHVKTSINFIKTLKNLDFLLSNSFYRLFLSQMHIKL